ncbi:MAG: hypothetical protein IT323_02570, partial [Anaerolineae bacterium]|nr:hypothetical protein [Anaerolineae bacterium]
MALTGSRTFVGFGFGAIQAGLFLYEAYQSGAFGRLIVAEVMPDMVHLLRGAGGQYTVNIAHREGVEAAHIGPISIEDPAVEADRARLIEAISAADEISTAIPSVAYYVSDRPGSLHRVLAEGLRRKAHSGGPRAVVYAAENHNHAAEILEKAVFDAIPADEHAAVRARVRFLNTVIGKMSGVLTDPAEIAEIALQPVTLDAGRAFLVEAFNRILISRIDFGGAPFARGIAVFEEKPDLLPFEEAKLHGHNAVHALAAYVGEWRGAVRIADLPTLPGMMDFLRAAFLDESGAALIRKHAGVDPLFTPDGYTAFADDLLARMVNPYLRDSSERVGRDPQRKLGWDDRLIGTMRVALSQGVTPRRFAMGAAAALARLDPAYLESGALSEDQL